MNKNKLLLLFAPLILLIAGLALLQYTADKTPPLITFNLPATIAPGEPLQLYIHSKNAGIAAFNIQAEQDNKKAQVIILENKTVNNSQQIKFCIAESGSIDGKITITANAQDKSFNNFFKGNKSSESALTYLDKTAPSATFDIDEIEIKKGESALVSFTVSEPVQAAKLSSGNVEFLLFNTAKNKFAAIITLPHSSDTELFALQLQLTDMVGNFSQTTVPLHKIDTVFREDEIKLNDAFINKKALEFSQFAQNKPEPLALYVQVNNIERAKNYAFIAELCKTTAPVMLWSEAFTPIPNAVRRSNFADQRFYTYNNEIVDRQVHLGLDYASVIHDRIPASNNGKVIFAGYLGIHGNMVLIDHGLGVHTMYSHLSEMFVTEGQELAKGQYIGLTGTTGMAGGDHLHFELLVNGISVNPLPWFDANWFNMHINNRLHKAF
ncbi:peptidoglycan DD-metalloendopeptidase family protein [Desulfovibrio sp. OttesenSCG-928-F07]|nr:peptidoglycan DD-metalloendopeptidase family protein [Desulfovibrio sp. OttesenSCG-928-F07]